MTSTFEKISSYEQTVRSSGLPKVDATTSPMFNADDAERISTVQNYEETNETTEHTYTGNKTTSRVYHDENVHHIGGHHTYEYTEPRMTTRTREITVPTTKTVNRTITVPTTKTVRKEITVPTTKVVEREITVPVTRYEKKTIKETVVVHEKKMIDHDIIVPEKKTIQETIVVPERKIITESIAVPQRRVVRREQCAVPRRHEPRQCVVREHHCVPRKRVTKRVTRVVCEDNCCGSHPHHCGGSCCGDHHGANQGHGRTTYHCGGNNGVTEVWYDNHGNGCEYYSGNNGGFSSSANMHRTHSDCVCYDGNSSEMVPCGHCNGTGFVSKSHGFQGFSSMSKSHGMHKTKSFAGHGYSQPNKGNVAAPGNPKARYWATAYKYGLQPAHNQGWY